MREERNSRRERERGGEEIMTERERERGGGESFKVE